MERAVGEVRLRSWVTGSDVSNFTFVFASTLGDEEEVSGCAVDVVLVVRS